MVFIVKKYVKNLHKMYIEHTFVKINEQINHCIMSADIKQRLKKLVNYAKYHGIAPTQKEFGEKLGYATEQYTSKIFSGRERNYADFAQKVKLLIPNLNVDWLLLGNGSMLLSSEQLTSDYISNATAENTLSEDSLIMEIKQLKETIAEIRNTYTEQLRKKDEQIDKLLNLLSR